MANILGIYLRAREKLAWYGFILPSFFRLQESLFKSNTYLHHPIAQNVASTNKPWGPKAVLIKRCDFNVSILVEHKFDIFFCFLLFLKMTQHGLKSGFLIKYKKLL